MTKKSLCEYLREEYNTLKKLKEECMAELYRTGTGDSEKVQEIREPFDTKKNEILTYIKSLPIYHLKRIKEKDPNMLTKEDLRFIYEIDGLILNDFSDERDILENILNTRLNTKKDLTIALDCREDQISFTHQEALSGDIVYHYGDLELDNLTTADKLKLPKIVGGVVYFDSKLESEIKKDKKLRKYIKDNAIKVDFDWGR